MAHTGEVGQIAVHAWERYKGGARITFVCGRRALETSRVDRDAVIGAVRALSVLPQDFSNMAAVQQGMKSAGFPGTLPNPYRERSTVNLHYQLSKYMGTGEPQDIQ